ncbi:IclR family transcriptional regulator [Nocardioides sp. Kera G14]|uniref:IclR family transcriptional regulator n=1 Tax=Nocardioides sp. Kera G14 TaxID=2884264 RepID=UPI001D108733|nr:IclR family transcriptional regulator [Nocardioides sp. Kera G14]UDY24580.1 IclR family transcriptional regulator [Nocardioides sp. Kera G14]
MSVLAKVAQVVEVLVSADGPIKLGDMAAQVQLPKSSLHRLLAELVELGLARGHDGAYRPGYRLVEWGHAADRSLGIRAAAEPLMRDLATRAGESVQLHVPERAHRVCAVSTPGPNTLQPLMLLGTVLPLGIGATGKVLLAHAPDEVQKEAWEEAPERARARWPSAEELDEIRDRGWAISVSEMEIGLTAVSAAVLGRSGAALAALTVAGPNTRLTEERQSEILPALLDTARSLARALSG